MSRNRRRIIAWAAALAVLAAGAAYTYSLDRRNKVVLEAMEHGHHCEHDGDLTGAVRFYRRALEAHPAYLPARVSLAEAYTMQGKREQARRELQRAVEIAPRDPEAHIARATYLMGEHSHREAAACLEAGIKVAPRHVHMRLLLASCLRREGQLEQARQELLEIEKIAPGHPAARAALRALDREAPEASNSHDA